MDESSGAFAGITYEQRIVAEQEMNLRPLYDLLQTAKDIEGALSFGPTFHMSTSDANGAMPYKFRTIWVNNALDKNRLAADKGDQIDKSLVILAEDEAGEIVGYRKSEFWENGGDLDGMGDIFTSARAQGVATPIELVHLLMLDSLAWQRKPHKVVYTVEKGNPKMHEIIVDNLLGRADDAAISLVGGKNAELQRWYHLYGSKEEGGILGFDERGKREFHGDIEPLTNMANTADVTLKRATYYDDVLAREISYAQVVRGTEKHIADAHLFQSQQLHHLAGSILPRMAATVGSRQFSMN